MQESWSSCLGRVSYVDSFGLNNVLWPCTLQFHLLKKTWGWHSIIGLWPGFVANGRRCYEAQRLWLSRCRRKVQKFFKEVYGVFLQYHVVVQISFIKMLVGVGWWWWWWWWWWWCCWWWWWRWRWWWWWWWRPVSYHSIWSPSLNHCTTHCASIGWYIWNRVSWPPKQHGVGRIHFGWMFAQETLMKLWTRSIEEPKHFRQLNQDARNSTVGLNQEVFLHFFPAISIVRLLVTFEMNWGFL